MMAYLVNMTARLIPLHRVLKSTGSLYLHCDPTASHYLKIILDTIFGIDQFRNEIIWKRTSARSDSHKWNHIHDTILFYSKSDRYRWNPQYTPYGKEYVDNFYRYVEAGTGRRYASDNLTADGTREGSSGESWRGINVRAKGLHWKYTIERLEELDREGRIIWPNKKDGVPRYKRYFDEMPGVAIQSIITDVSPLSGQSREKLGYPTQKPEALLERIIRASTNEGDWILDSFCGCGTTVAVAERLNRHWIGFDISIQAIKVIKQRLQHHYPGIQISLDGIPMDYESACSLAEKDKYQFQDWAISLIDAHAPSGVTKKGADRGIDGFILFYERVDFQKAEQKQRKIVVQVKGGVRERRDIATLKGDMERENAPMGVFVTLLNPTPEMKREAALADDYAYSDTKVFPKVQILSIQEWFQGKVIQLPSSTVNPFKMAEAKADQQHLFSVEVA